MKSLFDTKISYYRNVEDNVGTEISANRNMRLDFLIL